MNIYDLALPYIKDGMISDQGHPEREDLRILNYTQKCQFDGVWDDVTRACRGLIIDRSTGVVLARPFPKFFNYQEHVEKGWPIPASEPIIAEKLDGSLGILYALNGVPWIATRGSFMSDQAQWATQWYRQNIGVLPDPDITHLFEIVYPENRIVVNYSYSGLVHLSSRLTATGEERDWDCPSLIRRPKLFPATSLEELAKLDEPGGEGFVVFYPKENVRMKIKFPEYVRLHRIITGISEIAIWEYLRDGKDIGGLLDKVPDEFFRWVQDVVRRLEDQFNRIKFEASKTVIEARRLPTRKEQAEIITASQYPGVSFLMLDGKDYSGAIWKLIRPHGRSQFKIDIDS